MVERELHAEKRHYILPAMLHDMPTSLLVFAASFTPETPNFGTFGGVAHPLEELFKFFLNG